MTVYVLPPRAEPIGTAVNVTSRSIDGFSMLSPFFLGPVDLYHGYRSLNVENAWQYSKVYAEHSEAGCPADSYWDWALYGWGKKWADRYPMGKGRVPLYSWWNGEALGYMEARKRIYLPLYAGAARSHIEGLRHMAAQGDITIVDFDAYDHRALGYSYEDVLGDPQRKMGHGFVLAMMIEGYA